MHLLLSFSRLPQSTEVMLIFWLLSHCIEPSSNSHISSMGQRDVGTIHELNLNISYFHKKFDLSTVLDPEEGSQVCRGTCFIAVTRYPLITESKSELIVLAFHFSFFALNLSNFSTLCTLVRDKEFK